MVGYIPLDDTWFYGIIGLCAFILILSVALSGRGKYWKWGKTGSIITIAGLVMGGLVIPAIQEPMTGAGGNGLGFTPLFQFTMALSADCNDLTGLDAVQDCADATEQITYSDDKTVDMLYTIDQELVTLVAPDESAADFVIERVCEGPAENDPIHCPIESGVFVPATVGVEIISVPTIGNITMGTTTDLFQTTAQGVDIISWSDQANIRLGEHKCTPLQLQPGQEGTITFTFEVDINVFASDYITAATSIGDLTIKVAGQTVTYHNLIVGYTA